MVYKIKIKKEINPKPLSSGFRFIIKKNKKGIFHSNLYSTKEKAKREAEITKRSFEED